MTHQSKGPEKSAPKKLIVFFGKIDFVRIRYVFNAVDVVFPAECLIIKKR